MSRENKSAGGRHMLCAVCELREGEYKADDGAFLCRECLLLEKPDAFDPIGEVLK